MSRGVAPGRLAYVRWRTARVVTGIVAPIGEWLMHPPRLRKLRLIPSVWPLGHARYKSPRRPWQARFPEIPASLAGAPGIPRDPAAENEKAATEPLQDFTQVHHESTLWLVRKQWRSLMPTAPRLLRALTEVKTTNAVTTVARNGKAPDDDAQELTDAVKAYAASIGMSTVGIAAYDSRYTFAPNVGQNVGDRVIVCILEQNFEMTQRIPSAGSEQTALSTYGEVLTLANQLARHLHGLGYRAQTHDLQGHSIVIHYGVEAGLGQLGLNGQLLTPAAGSRCRITVIDTNAPLVLDAPVDLGIDKVCDECRICVRRCPSGAITQKRDWHRGVLKAKINTSRCLPLVAQVNGCAICMKVCPVQRYGLTAVVEEWERTGTILGKGTDELEGYQWPLDGRRYTAGERPRIEPEFFNPPEAGFDFTRRLPITTERDLF